MHGSRIAMQGQHARCYKNFSSHASVHMGSQYGYNHLFQVTGLIYPSADLKKKFEWVLGHRKKIDTCCVQKLALIMVKVGLVWLNNFIQLIACVNSLAEITKASLLSTSISRDISGTRSAKLYTKWKLAILRDWIQILLWQHWKYF